MSTWASAQQPLVAPSAQVYTLVTVDRLREVYATAHPRAR
jgi:site-specific recombinase XerC